ncbi:MAG: glycosyltransferase family 2 protein [Paludibacter sp.]
MHTENKILLSIVIPFYNVEKHIEDCLLSVYNQDLPEEMYEVICVNDASPDNSRSIVVEFQKNHTNLILVDHSYNKKLGAARNTGRSIAKGKYIWNVDSDDYIKPNVLKKLTETCLSNDLDILMINFYHNFNGVERINSKYPFKESNVQSGISFIKNYCLNSFGEISPVWSQLYKKDFLFLNKISSPESNYAEDAPFTFKSLFLANKVKSVVTAGYVYKLNQNSIGSEIELMPTALKLYEKCFVSTIELKKISIYIPENELQIRQKFYNVYKYTISIFPQYISKMSDLEFILFCSLCRKYFLSNLNLIFLMSRKTLIKYLFCIIIPVLKRHNN